MELDDPAKGTTVKGRLINGASLDQRRAMVWPQYARAALGLPAAAISMVPPPSRRAATAEGLSANLHHCKRASAVARL